ncbi:hypothetical protein K456DRAFT_1456042 [Colletotrichum gloeosporioides 23]|nr:hypothetical protein K456DRAFT_1456042 [Colletotrichum gloeosporioides 23]
MILKTPWKPCPAPLVQVIERLRQCIVHAPSLLKVDRARDKDRTRTPSGTWTASSRERRSGVWRHVGVPSTPTRLRGLKMCRLTAQFVWMRCALLTPWLRRDLWRFWLPPTPD